MLKKYNGKSVAVLWSGGLDSTALALELAAIGAKVTCIYNTTRSVDKLGDHLSRRYAEPYFKQLGIKTHGVDADVPDELNADSSDTRQSYYALVLSQASAQTEEKFDHVVTGVLAHDQTHSSMRRLFEPLGIESPLAVMTHPEWHTWVHTVFGKYTWIKHLSWCDVGLNFRDYVACTPAKNPHAVCFKCHHRINGGYVDYSALGITVDDLAKFMNAAHDARGNSIGYAMGHLIATRKFYSRGSAQPVHFATPVKKRQIEEDAYLEKDIMLLFGVREYISGVVKDDRPARPHTNRPCIIQHVRIYLSAVKELMPEVWKEDFTKDKELCKDFIKQLVEHNYLPVGYEWAWDGITLKWSE